MHDGRCNQNCANTFNFLDKQVYISPMMFRLYVVFQQYIPWFSNMCLYQQCNQSRHYLFLLKDTVICWNIPSLLGSHLLNVHTWFRFINILMTVSRPSLTRLPKLALACWRCISNSWDSFSLSTLFCWIHSAKETQYFFLFFYKMRGCTIKLLSFKARILSSCWFCLCINCCWALNRVEFICSNFLGQLMGWSLSNSLLHASSFTDIT